MLKILVLWDVRVCRWVSGFRRFEILSGFCVYLAVGNVNTQRFSENSGNTRSAMQCHIPENMVSFITTLVSRGYRRYCEV